MIHFGHLSSDTGQAEGEAGGWVTTGGPAAACPGQRDRVCGSGRDRRRSLPLPGTPPLPFHLQTLLWLVKRERWRGSEQQQSLLGRGMGNLPGMETSGQNVAAGTGKSIPRLVLRWARADCYQQNAFELTFHGRCLLAGVRDVVRGKQREAAELQEGQAGARRGDPSAWTGNTLPAPTSFLCHRFPAWPWTPPCVFDTIARVGVPQTCPPSGDMSAGSCRGGQPGFLGSLRLSGINGRPWEKLGTSFARNEIPLSIRLAPTAWEGERHLAPNGARRLPTVREGFAGT